MRSMRILAVAVLAVVLALSAAQNAFAKVELAYDDGTTIAQAGAPGVFLGVWFSLPSGVSSARLLYIRWAWSQYPWVHVTDIYITGPDHVTTLVAPIAGDSDNHGIGCPVGWLDCNGVDVSSLGIVVPVNFYVILSNLGVGGNGERDGAASVPAHSFSGLNLAGLTFAGSGDYGIRVDIDPIVAPAGPVGGFMEPVNKVVVFAPYLALFGVLAVIVVVAVPWKKRGN